MVNTRVPVNVPGRTSFDKSYKNILTTKVGTITPLACKFVVPGSKVHLKIAMSAALPPLASDTFMRCSLKTEAFFVPMRLLYGGTESWLTGSKIHDYYTLTDVQAALPRVKFSDTRWNTDKQYLNPGTLADYLGARVDVLNSSVGISGSSPAYLNLFPFLAYHRVYDDWYRNAKVQTPVFQQPINVNLQTSASISMLPFVAFASKWDCYLDTIFIDGVHLGDLRQRNYGDDYFTIAAPSAQAGSPMSVSSVTAFTIASLRAANSMQQYLERNNLASPRMQDFVKSHYGADLMSGVAQRAVLLGSASFDVYSKGIEGTTTSSATNNPFTSVGARYGNAFASGSDFVCNFEANEPGYLLVNTTLVPEANYASGIDQHLRWFTEDGSQVDVPDPLLENTGNEPIYSSEFSGNLASSRGLVFGYVPRNTRHKTGLNEIHGLLRAGSSLDSFVAQRVGNALGTYSISSSFLEIPTTALDNVTAVTSALSTYGCWIDSFIDLKVSEPLVESAMPSLQDPAYEHGKTEYIKINGSRL